MKKNENFLFFVKHYDKMLVVVVLIGLIISLAYLIQNTQLRQQESLRFTADFETLKVLHPDVAEVDRRPLDLALDRLRNPFQMDDATNHPFLVAEERVWCFNCLQPILYTAEICPKCRVAQPPDEDEDHSTVKDGIPDTWKMMYGLSIYDKTLADRDCGNGFTYREMFDDGRRDPTNFSPTNHPAYLKYLVLESIVDIPFMLELRTAVKSVRDEKECFKYQVNDITPPRPTYYAYVGDEIAKTGWVIVEGTTKTVSEKRPGWPTPRDVVKHVITVENKDGKRVVLVQEQPPPSVDYVVTLSCSKLSSFQVKAQTGGSFELDDEEYLIIQIDKGQGNVVIKRVSDGQEFPMSFPKDDVVEEATT